MVPEARHPLESKGWQIWQGNTDYENHHCILVNVLYKNPRCLPQLSFYYMCPKYTNSKYSFMQTVDISIICSNENVPIALISSVYQKSMPEMIEL